MDNYGRREKWIYCSYPLSQIRLSLATFLNERSCTLQNIYADVYDNCVLTTGNQKNFIQIYAL